MPLRDLINSAAQSNGLSPDLLARIVQIESGGNPYARSGSYHGLLQLGKPEFARYNPQGDIYDPAANLNAGAAKIAGEAAAFQRAYGREPTPTEIYLQHQQGIGGAAAHMANPDAPAWQNMASTGEGRQKGDQWAKAAIWGNIPDSVKQQFPGGVNTVTSQDFMNIWRNKVEGQPGGPPPSGPVRYGEDAPALGTPPVAPQPQGATSPGQAPASAPAGGGGLLGMITQALGITPPAQPAAGASGIPAQAPQGIPPAYAQAYADAKAQQDAAAVAPPPPLQMPPLEQLQFANQQPIRLAPPPQVRFGRGFY